MLKNILLALLIVNYVHNVAINDTNLPTHIEYVLLDDPNPCARPCSSDSSPMTCRYEFNLEWYDTLSKACFDCPFNTTDCFRPDCIPGDGNKRPVLVVNRKLPGPLIEVCQGDEIVVDVINKMSSEGTTIHWHGQHVRDNPYMDGVPFVTQCPILPSNSFRYAFKAMNSGTHFWHSHTGLQRVDGAFGALVVKVPKDKDPHKSLYDYDLSDHVMVIIDWGAETGLQKYIAHHHNDGDNKPSTILVNGLGRFKEFDKVRNAEIFTPTARFTVQQGYRYRFRVINAGFLNCPIEVSVDNHTLHVISSDGSDFKAVEATSLVVYAGERFDFIVNANQEKDLYWIRFRGLMDGDERFTKAFQLAVLQYEGLNATVVDYPKGEPIYEEEPAPGNQVNSLNVGTENSDTTLITIPELESLAEYDSTLKNLPDEQIFITFDFYNLDNPIFHKAPDYGYNDVTNPKQQRKTPQLNHISMEMPTFPLLPQRHQIDSSKFCNASTVRNCTDTFCSCPHVLQVPLNSIVEIILIDEGFAYNANHPLHLHGHAFRVVAMERLGENTTSEEVKKLDKEGKIKRNLINPPIKDTVTVPDGGFTIVRFNASNPGYWLFHCHIEFHADIGMALVFKVGEHNDMLPVPRNFPTCGNYLPDDDNEKSSKELLCNNENYLINKLESILPKAFRPTCDNNAPNTARSNMGVSISFAWIIFAVTWFNLYQYLI